MPQVTWSELRRRGIEKAGLGRGGTLTGVTSASVFIDTARQEPNDYWTGGYFTRTQVASQEESQPVSAFSKATSQFTVTPALSAAPSVGDTYLATRGLPPIVIDATVRDSWLEAWKYLSSPVKLEALLTGAAFTVALLPAIARYGVSRVELQPWQAYSDMPWPSISGGWDLSVDGSVVEFEPNLIYGWSGRSVRLWGYQPLPDLDATAVFPYVEVGDDEIIVNHIAGNLLTLLGTRSFVPQASGIEAMDSPLRSGGAMLQQAKRRMEQNNRHLRTASVQSAWMERRGVELPW